MTQRILDAIGGVAWLGIALINGAASLELIAVDAPSFWFVSMTAIMLSAHHLSRSARGGSDG